VVFDVLYAEVGADANAAFSLMHATMPNGLHKYLAAMLARRNDVLTTNVDVMIELAARQDGVRLRIAATERAFARSRKAGTGTLYKLHGTLRMDGRTGRRSALQAAVRQVGKGLRQAPSDVLRRAFAESIVVVLGYSGRDDFDVNPALSQAPVRHVIWIEHAPGHSDRATGHATIVQPAEATLSVR
jgi:hypothetical protein